jgi:Cupin
MPSDVLSNVLRTVRLKAAVFFYVEATAPWSANTLSTSKVIHEIMPDAEHLIPYHVVTNGSCYGCVKGLPPVFMRQEM